MTRRQGFFELTQHRAPLVRSLIVWTPLSAVLGAGIVLFISLSTGSMPAFRILSFGMLAGAISCIYSHLLLWLVHAWIKGLRSMRLMVGLGMVFFAAGCCGWLTTAWIGAAFLGLDSLQPSKTWLFFLFIVGCLSLGVGLVSYLMENLRERLQASIAELKEQEFARRELELAGAIQRRLLAPQELERESYTIISRHSPARYVAGDFYDVLPFSDGSVGLVVADVLGKGMGASLIMASVKAMIPFLADSRQPEQALVELNRRLNDELAPRELVALILARFEPVTGVLSFANAGLPDPYLLREDRPPIALPVEGPRLPLGVRPQITYHQSRQQLGPGDRVLLLTDGMPEARTSELLPLGYQAFERILQDSPWESGQGWLDAVITRVRALTLEEQEDDWTSQLLEVR